MSDDIKRLHEEFKSVVGSALDPIRERMDEDRKRYDEVTGETKGAVEAVNARLDELEVAMQKAADDAAHKSDAPDVDEAKAIHHKAFEHFLKTGVIVPEVKDLVVGVDTQGGFLVPDDYRAELIKGLFDFSPVAGAVRTITTTRNEVVLPKRTGRPTAYWVAEGAARTESGSTYGQERIPTHEMATFTDASAEIHEDAAFDVAAEIRSDFTEEFARLEGYAIITGSGVGQPEGLMTNASVGETVSGTAATILDAAGTVDGLFNLMHAMRPAYAQNGTWVLNFATVGSLRTAKDSQNQYIWQPGSVAGAYPATIAGRPYIAAEDMPDEGANTYPVIFGDLTRAYVRVEKLALQVQIDPYTQNTASGAIRYVARRRLGGQVVLPEAVRKLKCST